MPPLSDHMVDVGSYVQDEDENRHCVTDEVQTRLGSLLMLTDDNGDVTFKHRAFVMDTFSEAEPPETPEQEAAATDSDRIAQLEAQIAEMRAGGQDKPTTTQGKSENGSSKPAAKRTAAAKSKPAARRTRTARK